MKPSEVLKLLASVTYVEIDVPRDWPHADGFNVPPEGLAKEAIEETELLEKLETAVRNNASDAIRAILAQLDALRGGNSETE